MWILIDDVGFSFQCFQNKTKTITLAELDLFLLIVMSWHNTFLGSHPPLQQRGPGKVLKKYKRRSMWHFSLTSGKLRILFRLHWYFLQTQTMSILVWPTHYWKSVWSKLSKLYGGNISRTWYIQYGRWFRCSTYI